MRPQIWLVLIRRYDHFEKRWKRSQLEVKVEDLKGQWTARDIWKVLRKTYPNRVHSSQVRIEREFI